MDGARVMYSGEYKRISVFGGNASQRQTTWMTQNDVKMGLKELGLQDVDWISK